MYNVLISLQTMMLVNVKLDVSGYNVITFHWFTSFLMAQLKQNWQHWHSCIVDSLWELTPTLQEVQQILPFVSTFQNSEWNLQW